jgi:hypothetical protein
MRAHGVDMLREEASSAPPRQNMSPSRRRRRSWKFYPSSFCAHDSDTARARRFGAVAGRPSPAAGGRGARGGHSHESRCHAIVARRDKSDGGGGDDRAARVPPAGPAIHPQRATPARRAKPRARRARAVLLAAAVVAGHQRPRLEKPDPFGSAGALYNRRPGPKQADSSASQSPFFFYQSPHQPNSAQITSSLRPP